MNRPHTRRRTVTAAALALTATLALGACSTGDAAEKENGLAVTGAYMPQPVMTDMAGGFLTLENHGDRDDTLTRVTSGIAASVEMHETRDNAMQQVDSLPVPAGGELRLSRGGNHLMFHDLKRKPAKGDTVTLKLYFAHHDPLTVSVPVKATNHDPGAGHHK